jgi:hypothetical protein
MKVVAQVLKHPERFATAAEVINADLAAKSKSDDDGNSYTPAFWLTYMLPDVVRAGPPALSGSAYVDWTHRLMLLATLATYPGDLSHFGACGAIPWDHGTVYATFGKDDDSMPLPAPGRAWILMDLDGTVRDEMHDKAGEYVEQRFGELVDGKRQNVTKRTPCSVNWWTSSGRFWMNFAAKHPRRGSPGRAS